MLVLTIDSGGDRDSNTRTVMCCSLSLSLSSEMVELTVPDPDHTSVYTVSPVQARPHTPVDTVGI